MVHLALHAASTMAQEGIEVEVIDVGTLMPFDAQPCVDSVLRTGRLVVLHEAQWSGGLGHTIQSRIMESAFYALEAAPVVIGALDTPVPFSPPSRTTRFRTWHMSRPSSVRSRRIRLSLS